jgi:hypothetical protein
MRLNNLLVQAIRLVPDVLPYLKGRARWMAYQPAEYKTYDYMLSAVTGLVNGVYSGLVGGAFIDTMANIISGQLTQAYRQAFEDEGYTDFELPDYLAASLEAMILGQYDYVDGFYRDIVDARVDGTPVSPLLSRAAMWSNQWTAAYNEALRLITLENGGNMIWILGEAEHCPTCLALDGIVASAKEWQDSGWKPQGENLACHGFNCKCSCPPTSQRRSKNAAQRLAAIT